MTHEDLSAKLAAKKHFLEMLRRTRQLYATTPILSGVFAGILLPDNSVLICKYGDFGAMQLRDFSALIQTPTDFIIFVPRTALPNLTHTEALALSRNTNQEFPVIPRHIAIETVLCVIRYSTVIFFDNTLCDTHHTLLKLPRSLAEAIIYNI